MSENTENSQNQGMLKQIYSYFGGLVNDARDDLGSFYNTLKTLGETTVQRAEREGATREGGLTHFPLSVDARSGSPLEVDGSLPKLTEDELTKMASGDAFGSVQDAGMAGKSSLPYPIPADGNIIRDKDRKQFLIMSTAGGMRSDKGQLQAFGLHTGHFELGDMGKAVASAFVNDQGKPYYVAVSDPCDGRTQGTDGMMDSLSYRNDAVATMNHLRRSLPNRDGVLGIATCDKGAPAMMMSLAGEHDKPTIFVPGGVTLTANDIIDLGKIQANPTKVATGEMKLDDALLNSCASCGTPGGGCHFLGTAATAQVVAEALGLALPHSALTPSGDAIWYDMGRRSADALVEMQNKGITTKDILTQDAIWNAMVVHAAVGGSTNLLIHLPAIAEAAGLKAPTREEWEEINRYVPNMVDVLPAGKYSTAHFFSAGGVPEVMLKLRKLGLLNENVMTVTGKTLGENLDEWEHSKRRQDVRENLETRTGVNPDDLIKSVDQARAEGRTGTITFPGGNLAPLGSVIKSSAIKPSEVHDGVYHLRGPAKVFTKESDAINAVKAGEIKAGDVMILMGSGPMGTGMEETFQITGALAGLSYGSKIALITDGRFSGVSTGACIGHVGPEALADGPIGKVQNGDVIDININTKECNGSINLVGTHDAPDKELTSEEGAKVLSNRLSHPALKPRENLPEDVARFAATSMDIEHGFAPENPNVLKNAMKLYRSNFNGRAAA